MTKRIGGYVEKFKAIIIGIMSTLSDKYAVIFTSFLFMMINNHKAAASAWLLKEDKYRYGVSFNYLDQASRKHIKQQAVLYSKLV